MVTYILLGILTLLISAFFSGIEMAYVSASRLHVELKRKQGTRKGKIISKFFEKPSEFLGTTLVGNNIALVLFGIIIEKLLEKPIIEALPIAFQNDLVVLLLLTLIITIIVLIFGEFIPKALFRLNPDKIISFMAFPLEIIRILMSVLVWMTVKLSYLLLRLILRTEIKEDEQVFTKLDLEHFIKNFQPDSEEEIDTELFENALYLPTLKVRESMVPRTEIVGVDFNDGVEALKAAFIENKLSRIIIYDETFDEIKGYVHHHLMLENPKDIKKVLLPIQIVPEVMPVRELMNLFIKLRVSIACVVDEFGGTSGIITMEDIVEEIVGEIEDEHDDENRVETKLADTEYLFSGRLEVDYLNEKYGFDLPEGEYHTLSGYIVTMAETIPEEKQEFIFDQYRFVLEQVSETKIEIIRMLFVEQEEEG